ncbi:MAG TPA: lamin tail domain-containing protein, partial [Ignavibacteriaceae bacterium]
IISNDIVINEFMADNAATITDPSGEYDDWIELYNPTSDPIVLTGRYLTDKKDNLTKYQFTQDNLILNPNEYLLIWCDEQGSQQGIHTNFKLSKDGEFIGLVDSDGISIIDSITFGPQTTDISFGRYPDGANEWVFMSPTPGATNNIVSVDDEEIIPTEFSLSAYPNPFNPSTTIRFSTPPASSPLVKGRNEVGFVTLRIYDILGNEIATLVNEEKPPSTYEVLWNGENNLGSKVSSGIYFVRIQANQQFKNLKLMLLK